MIRMNEDIEILKEQIRLLLPTLNNSFSLLKASIVLMEQLITDLQYIDSMLGLVIEAKEKEAKDQ